MHRGGPGELRIFGVEIFGIAYFRFESRSAVPFASIPSAKLSPPQSSLMLIFHEREVEQERENDATAVWKRKRDESAFRAAEGEDVQLHCRQSFLPEVLYLRGRPSVWYFAIFGRLQ